MRRRRIPPSKRILTIGQQVSKMRSDFPAFTYRREGGVPTWRGTLQPTESSPIYEVKLVYSLCGKYHSPPSVWIESPVLHPYAPHRYRSGALCLYLPRDWSWTPHKYISKTIVLWAALWLAFYEIWIDTGHWYGPEAPHAVK
jgi:hypothetical protein